MCSRQRSGARRPLGSFSLHQHWTQLMFTRICVNDQPGLGDMFTLTGLKAKHTDRTRPGEAGLKDQSDVFIHRQHNTFCLDSSLFTV